MKKAVWSGVIAVAGVLFLSSDALAQSAETKPVNVSLTMNARAKLTLGGATTISWADADPDVTAVLTSGDLTVDVKARTGATETVTLTVTAADDFKNAAGDTIALNTLSWSGGGDAGFNASGSSAKTAQTVGTFTGSGQRDATYVYSLPNLWTYAAGSYNVRLDYTLTAP